VEKSHAMNRQGMNDLTAEFSRLGLEYIASRGNFVAFRVGDGARVNQKLLQAGMIVRPLAGYGMPEWLRVTIGTAAENARFLSALPGSLADGN
jgi:histidinol-phosphate aminotransferase